MIAAGSAVAGIPFCHGQTAHVHGLAHGYHANQPENGLAALILESCAENCDYVSPAGLKKKKTFMEHGRSVKQI